MNWIYVGQHAAASGIMLRGKLTHCRTVNSKFGTSRIDCLRRHVDRRACRVTAQPKHKYLYSLDDEMEQRIRPSGRPYPKRAASKDIVAPEAHSGEAGEAPSA